MNEREKQAVLMMAECNMNSSLVARKMGCNRTSVIWALDKVQEKTGLDPRNFYNLVELLTKMRGYGKRPSILITDEIETKGGASE